MSGISIYVQAHQLNRQVEIDAIAAGELDGKQTSAVLDYLFRLENAASQNQVGASLLVSELSGRPNLSLGLLLDETDTIMASTNYQLRGQSLGESRLDSYQSLIAAVETSRRGSVILTPDRRQVIAVYPVVFGLAPGEVIPSRFGVLLLDYDLSQAKRKVLSAAIAQSGQQIVLLAIACLILLLFLEFTVTRRAAHLVHTSQALAAGDLTSRSALTGSDELAKISGSFDQMAQQIQENTTALQTSEMALRQQTQELTQLLQELRQTQMQLVQTEKMSSLGQLVAGVAHEINNPVNFIYGNITHARSYTEDLLHIIDLYQTYYPQPVPEIIDEIEATDLEFLKSDFPKMLDSMRIGAERIQGIVKSLRIFSRMDEAAIKSVNIHDGIDSTLVILHNRLKAKEHRPEIFLSKTYADLPPLECYAGQLNQVFMNIISNAIDALEDHCQYHPDFQPEIEIATQFDDRYIWIEISDNGPGIPPAVQARLFDPFFTTKPVGKGTGMGLSISYQVIVDKHGGDLICTSAPGQGTTFRLKIPRGRAPSAIASAASARPT